MDSIDIGQPYSTCEGVEADTETERTYLVRFHRLPNVSCLLHCYRVSKKKFNHKFELRFALF